MQTDTNSITIQPVSPIYAEITPPGSKSVTNRALAIAAFADGESILEGALDSEDTQMMMDSLRKMGVVLDHDPETAARRSVFSLRCVPMRTVISGSTAWSA